MATLSSILIWKIPCTEEPGSPWGRKESDTTEHVRVVKNRLPIQEMQVRSQVQEDPLKEETATHSSILALRIPWTEETGGLQSMELQRVRHD